MRTLTAYGIGVVIVLAVLNGIAWQVGKPPLHELKVFSAGFVLGVLGRTLRLSSTVIAGSPDFRLSCECSNSKAVSAARSQRLRVVPIGAAWAHSIHGCRTDI